MRSSYAGLVRNGTMTAWRGRSEERTDASVWAVTCLFVVREHRGRGFSRGLARAAVELARERGARVLEAYPVTEHGLIWGEAHPGHLSVYLAAGFAEVHRPSKRRAVVRVELCGVRVPTGAATRRAGKACRRAREW